MRACLLGIVLGLLGCQTIPAPGSAASMPPGTHAEIWGFRCAGEDELRYGDTGTELWGEGWHYIEKLRRCTEA